LCVTNDACGVMPLHHLRLASTNGIFVSWSCTATVPPHPTLEDDSHSDHSTVAGMHGDWPQPAQSRFHDMGLSGNLGGIHTANSQTICNGCLCSVGRDTIPCGLAGRPS